MLTEVLPLSATSRGAPGPREGYIAETHGLVEALTKKQERLHMAMATGVLCVKLERDSMTQSRTMDDCPVLCRVWNTCKGREPRGATPSTPASGEEWWLASRGGTGKSPGPTRSEGGRHRGSSALGPHLVHYGGHELRVRLLVGKKLSNDLVHDVLGREEVI